MAGSRKKLRKNANAKNALDKKRADNLLLFLIALVIVFSVFVFIYSSYNIENINRNLVSINSPVYKPFISSGNSTSVSMQLPAVDDKGQGVTTALNVQASPGSGRTLVDIDNLLFWADTQQSIRVARLVAANLTGLDVSKYDLVYNIQANANIIGGGSAGAALTIATIAAIQNKSLRKDVMITGAVNHDGTIGPVSEILAKAKVSKSLNASLFLVPLLQSIEVVYETSRHCEKFSGTEVCTVEQVPKKLKVQEEAGIKVIEVGTIEEAMEYLIG